jgi:hypothetical protein
METGLLNAVVNMYNTVSGNKAAADEIVLEFVDEPIDEPLDHYSRISGKIPIGRHILAGTFPKKALMKFWIVYEN